MSTLLPSTVILHNSQHVEPLVTLLTVKLKTQA